MAAGHIIRGGKPSALHGLIAIIFVVGVPFGSFLFFRILQLWLVFRAFTYVRAKLSSSSEVAAASLKPTREPGSAAEYRAWLFKNTHERLPPVTSDEERDPERVALYRALYIKHRGQDSVTSTHAPPKGVKAYLRDGGRVVVTTPPPRLTPAAIILVLFFGSIAGAFVRAAGEAIIPFPKIPTGDAFAHLLPAPLLPPLTAVLGVLSVSPRSLLRALGTSAAAACVGLVARPGASTSSFGALFLMTAAAAYFGELHADVIFLRTITPTLFKLAKTAPPLIDDMLGKVMFSPLTLPILRMLISAAAACVSLEHTAHPMDDRSLSTSAVAQRHTSRRARGVAMLTLLLLGSGGAFVAQDAQRRYDVHELGRLVARGDVYTAFVRVGFLAYSAFLLPHQHGASPPPSAPIHPDEMERRARAYLGVAADAEWADIKKSYREKALESHPDKLRSHLGRDPTEEELASTSRRFKDVRDAFEVLENLREERERAASLKDEV